MKLKIMIPTIAITASLTVIAFSYQNCSSDFNPEDYQSTDNSSVNNPPPEGNDLNDIIDTNLPTSRTYVGNDLKLEKNQSVETDRLVLVQQADGNLVIYQKPVKTGDAAVWASRSVGDTSLCSDSCFTQFQTDGNFVSYSRQPNSDAYKTKYAHCSNSGASCDVPYWASGFAAAPNDYKLKFQSTAPYLQIVNKTDLEIWRSDTPVKLLTPPEEVIGLNNGTSYITWKASATNFNNLNNQVSFTVVVQSPLSVSYQWYRVSTAGAATAIAGATAETLSFALTNENQFGTYRVVIQKPFSGAEVTANVNLTRFQVQF